MHLSQFTSPGYTFDLNIKWERTLLLGKFVEIIIEPSQSNFEVQFRSRNWTPFCGIEVQNSFDLNKCARTFPFGMLHMIFIEPNSQYRN